MATIKVNCGQRKIPLSRGCFSIVDARHYQDIVTRKWYVMGKERWNQYAATSIGGNHIRLHWFIASLEGHDRIKGMEIDHINHNGLDNRWKNLRICTHAQNQHNKCSVWGVSRFKGVSRILNNKKNPWKACIKWKGKGVHLGSFSSEEDAAVAYDVAAQILFGSFAFLNSHNDKSL